MLRALGFSYAPSLFAILGLIPGIGFLIVFIAGVWALIASVIALRQALEVSTGRAVAIVVVAFLAMIVVLAIIVAVFGISIVATRSPDVTPRLILSDEATAASRL